MRTKSILRTWNGLMEPDRQNTTEKEKMRSDGRVFVRRDSSEGNSVYFTEDYWRKIHIIFLLL